MINFLFKSSISLLALLIFYHLILEKEKMHHFNRFYLLFGIIFSFALPFITIEIITETIAPIQQTYTHVAQENLKTTEITETKETIDYKPIVLWCLYGLVTSILLFRYIRNILKIVSNIKSNPIVAYKNAKLVLLEQQTPPHTFLNYIFLNKADYQNRTINEELYTHELIHVNQKHTLDVLLVEAVKTVFWFNPIFIFYKKAIQLNHEFLADEKVVTTYENIPFYQNLLLAHASTNPTFGLTSNLNYSITKKRFIMMTKNVSRTRILLSKIVLLPFLSGLIFFMCVESIAQVNQTNSSKKENNLIAENTNKTNSNWTVSAGRNENPPTKEPELMMSYEYNLEGIKINAVTLQNSMLKLSNYVGNTYEAPKTIDKMEEMTAIRFFLKKDGSITDIRVVGEKGTEMETKLMDILKSSPKSIFTNIYGETDFDKILIKMTFWSKEINEIMAKQPGFTGKVAFGFFCIPGTYPLHEVDVKPEFPGGNAELNRFILKNFKALKDCSEIKLHVGFVVEEDGSLSNFNPINDNCPGSTDEAIRVLKNSPKWKPAEKDGKVVRVSYDLPISILADKK